MTVRHLCSALAFVLAAMLFCGAPAFGQQQAKIDYTTGKSHLPNIFGPYFPRDVAEPTLTNSPRAEQLIREGKLMLSLQDAIALAVENNLDVSVQRYTRWMAQSDVRRARAGLGTAAGRFDPLLTSTFSWDRRSSPVNNPYLAGTGTLALTALTSQTTQSNFSYQQGFVTGTSYTVSLNNTRQSSTSPAQLFNPSVQSQLIAAFSQPLLNGFGYASNKRSLRIALNNRKAADLTFSEQLITTVSSVQNMYWDLVFAREDVKVKQRSVELAEKLYRDNVRQVEIGTLAPIEVVRAEAEVARTHQDLIVSQTYLLQQQTLLRNAITKNPLDAMLKDAEIVPTDVINKPPAIESKLLQDAVQEAYESRPDVRRQRITLENTGIDVHGTRNAMLPTLTVSGQWASAGLAGNSRLTTSTLTGFLANTLSPLVDATGTPVLIGGQPVYAGSPDYTRTISILKSGVMDAYGRVFSADFPTYSVSLNLQIPIRNRAAQADNDRAILTQRQAEVTLRRLQNSIVVEVRNAQIGLEQNQARVAAAQKSRELAERTLDAEQKKYQLGASTIFFVIQAQRDLAAAQSTEVRALADLLKANVEYERAMGRTLDVNKIDVEGAQVGSASLTPNIPGTIKAEVGDKGSY
jgi:outer membrane protein TolC